MTLQVLELVVLVGVIVGLALLLDVKLVEPPPMLAAVLEVVQTAVCVPTPTQYASPIQKSRGPNVRFM